MLDWIEVLFRLLSQFTGIQGGVDNIIVVYGIAAIFYSVLFSFAKSNYQDTASFRDRLLQWGFGFGLARELFMLAMAVILAEGLVEPGTLYQLFPPVEHTFLGLAFVMIASAYIGYFTNNNVLALRYLKAGMTVNALAYLATFWWWFIYIRANPTHHFADVWCDHLFHANGAFWLLLATYLIYKNSRPDTARNLVLSALCFMALSTFLKIPDIVLHEVYIAVIAPTARTLYLSAILMLGYAYISEQIQKRKFAEAKILEQASTMQLLMNHSPAALAMFDRQMCYLAYSQRWIADYSLGDQNIIGRSLYDVFPGIPENWKLLHRRALEGEVLHEEDAFVRLDGTIQRLKLEIRPWSANNQIGGIIIFSEDITERTRIERMKNEFISTVSHELRTPLTSIRGALGLAAGGVAGELPAQLKSLIDIAHKNSERLILLVNDILDIEKIGAGKMEFQLVQAELLPLIALAVDSNRPHAEQLSVTYELNGDLAGVMVYVDANRLLQVLTNLLSNAAKFSPAGDKVMVTATKNGNRVRVAVSDHGSGIDDQFRSQIFKRFSQADSSDTRKKGGTGLGLSITKAIVEIMGGSIGFDSQPNILTTFWVEFPILQEAVVPSVSAK